MSLPTIQFPLSTSIAKPYGSVESSLQSSPAREEGEVPESELDPDTRRRLLILQHGQDTRENAPPEPPFPVRPPVPVSAPRVQPHGGGWLPAEEMSPPRQPNLPATKEFPFDSQQMQIDTHRTQHPSFFSKVESSIPPDRIMQENQRLPKEVIGTSC